MKAIRILINVTLPIFLIMLFASLLTTKGYLLMSKGLYPSHENVYFDHDYAADRIMGYLNYRYDNLEFGLNEDDDSIIMDVESIEHMVDVKNVYTGLRIFAFSALIIAVSCSYLLFKKDKMELYKAYKYMFVGPVVFIVFLGGAMLIDFNRAFTVFHELFFPGGGWTLSSNSVLILLLPLDFWMVSGLIILGLFSMSLGVIYFVNEKIHKSLNY